MVSGIFKIFLFSGLLLASLLTITPGSSFAQRYHIQTFHEQDGVASNTVFNSAQDSLGNMWFATRNGLTVFNGINWRTIHSDDPAVPRGEGLVSIDDNGIVWWVNRRPPFNVSRLVDGHWKKLTGNQNAKLFSEISDIKTWVDSTGKTTLAIAAYNGHLQIWKNETWITPTFDQPFLKPHSMAMDGSILLISTLNGLLALDLNSPREPYPLELDLPPGQVYGVSTDAENGVMWVIGHQWLAQFKNKKLEEVFHFPNLFRDKMKPGLSVCQSPNGGIYIVDYSNVLHFHPQWGLETITPDNGVATDGGNHVMMDREKIIWICSSRGISKIMSRRLACFNTDHGLLGDEVSSVLQRKSGVVVLGHRTGLTFLDPHPRTLSFDSGPLAFSRATDLAEDADGNLWIAANYQGLGRLNDDDSIRWYGPENGLHKSVYSVMSHPDLGLFVGTAGGVFKQDGDDFRKIELPGIGSDVNLVIRRLIPLSNDGFAITTRKFGVFFWQGDTITHVPGSDIDGSNNTYTVFEHSTTKRWVGTNSGLFLLKDGQLVRTSAPDPVINRPIYGIIQDDQGRFWFGTDDGVTIWDGENTTRLTAEEGLLGSETNRDALLCDQDGHIWIGTDSGVSVFRQEFDTPRTVVPILSLTSLRIDGQRYPTDKPLRIEGPLSSLVFLFHATTFASEKPLRFTARTTIESDNEPSFYLTHWPGVLPMTNVSPGQFQVQIVGHTSEGLKTNTITTPLIVITPPLKDRWYWRALIALAVALLMWLVFAYFSGRRYARRLEKEVLLQTRGLRKSEEVARHESERLTSTLESISDGVVVVDGQNRVVLLNPAAVALIARSKPPEKGCSLEEILPVTALCDPEQAKQYKHLLKNPAGLRLASEQVAIFCGENQICWLEVSAVPITGSPGGLVFAFRDITQRRQTEQKERRSQKLESLGLLAGGIAHDFNNLLTIMMGNLSLARNTLNCHEPENSQLEKVHLASRRAQNLTRQLLTFAKGGGPVRETTDLTPIIRDSTSFNLSGSNVDCQLDLSDDLCWAMVDADQFYQVIGNLVINARQAMSGGGQLKITAQNADSWPGFTSDKKLVVIEIQDHGIGISDKDQARIFDPYFTTKERGTGLGLAIANSIVEKHDGLLTVESTPGAGSTFRLILPACDEVLETPELETAQNSPQPMPPLKILFMDDEEEIRLILAQMLERLNHQWVGAAHGESARNAFAIAAKEGHPFDLAILDLTIPGGMGGLETLSELRKINPMVKVVVASGYSDDPVMSYHQKFGFSGILKKPYSKEDLQRVIGELMNS
jgi:PAS domain S-box-containing protein